MSRPILQSAEVFELIARGDLTKHMNSKRSDEIGLLAKPAENTTEIAEATEEISGTTQSMDTRTEFLYKEIDKSNRNMQVINDHLER